MRLACRPGFYRLWYTNLCIGVLPAVRPDGRRLAAVEIVDGHRAGQTPLADRRIEMGIVQRASPAFGLAIEAAIQRQLARDRFALHIQLQLMLTLVAVRIQRQQADVQRILLQLLDAQLQFTRHLFAGTHVAIQRNAINLHLLPAQTTSIEIGQQLRGFQGATRFEGAVDDTAQTGQRIVELWRVDAGIKIQTVAQRPFDIQMVASQRQLNARHRPLVVAVTGQRAVSGHGVLLHVSFQLKLRHTQLPAAAIQTAAGGDFSIQPRWPVRILFCGVDPGQRQLTAPADRLAPVHQRGEVNIALQCSHAQAIQAELLNIAFTR